MSQGSGGSALIFLLPIVLIGYLFITQRRRQRDAVSRQQSVQVGDEVRTTSGLFGYVVSLEDTVVTLEASPGVKLRFDRRAIASVVPPVQPSEDIGPGAPPSSPITDR